MKHMYMITQIIRICSIMYTSTIGNTIHSRMHGPYTTTLNTHTYSLSHTQLAYNPVEETVEQQHVVAEQVYDNYSVAGGSKYKRLLTWKHEYWKHLYPIVSDYLQSQAHYLSHRLLKRPRLDVDGIVSVLLYLCFRCTSVPLCRCSSVSSFLSEPLVCLCRCVHCQLSLITPCIQCESIN